jgi:hypothetical protein
MRANILTNNIIGDAMELIEEDNAPNEEDMSRDQEDSDDDLKSKQSEQPAQVQVFKEDYSIPDYLWNIEKIRDWGIRIQAYTEEQKAFYNDMVPKI